MDGGLSVDHDPRIRPSLDRDHKLRVNQRRRTCSRGSQLARSYDQWIWRLEPGSIPAGRHLDVDQIYNVDAGLGASFAMGEHLKINLVSKRSTSSTRFTTRLYRRLHTRLRRVVFLGLS